MKYFHPVILSIPVLLFFRRAQIKREYKGRFYRSLRAPPWFHRIDLGVASTTKTESVMGEPVDHPGAVAYHRGMHPRRPRGKSVLDVAARGFYRHRGDAGGPRASRRGRQRQHVRQAVFVRKALGSMSSTGA